MKSPAEYSRFVLEIEKGRNEANRASKEFAFGCRFGPLDDPTGYVQKVESYRAAGLTCYQLGVNVRKHSTELLREFGDTVIATS